MTPLSLPLRRVDLTTACRRKALENVAQTEAVQDLARGSALKTQAAMEIQANKKRGEVDFHAAEGQGERGPRVGSQSDFQRGHADRRMPRDVMGKV